MHGRGGHLGEHGLAATATVPRRQCPRHCAASAADRVSGAAQRAAGGAGHAAAPPRRRHAAAAAAGGRIGGRGLEPRLIARVAKALGNSRHAVSAISATLPHVPLSRLRCAATRYAAQLFRHVLLAGRWQTARHHTCMPLDTALEAFETAPAALLSADCPIARPLPSMPPTPSAPAMPPPPPTPLPPPLPPPPPPL